jgi:hypothetical protein
VSTFIDYNAKIVPGESIGNICLSESAEKWTAVAYAQGLQVSVNSFSSDFEEYILDNGVISFVTSKATGLIQNICCSPPFLGTFQGISVGITVESLLGMELQLTLLHGFLLLNQEFTIGFSLPNEYDRFDIDYVSDLPPSLLLDKLYIMQEDWWRGLS